jgi:Mn2+/Fe2+ NRAMP family transporter
LISAGWRQKFHAVGPGILFAGAAIGVSHLVQATRAGAGYGFDLLWAVILVLLFKYPFFQYSHRYTVATGESLLQGYRRLGVWALALFMGVVVISSFITMAAVTVVTAGLAGVLLGLDMSLTVLSLILLVVIMGMLVVGHYRLLDSVMKIMVLVLGVLTLTAVGIAVVHGPAAQPGSVHPAVWSVGGMTFLLALMGWMPAPLDIGAWSSLWILAKHKKDPTLPTMRQALLDFNLGYAATVVLAFAFISFGALVMFGTGTEFSSSGTAFAGQLVEMYASTLGDWSRWLITLVAFITMFSTTITVLDGYSRTLAAGTGLLFHASGRPGRRSTFFFMVLLVVLAVAIIAFFMGGFRNLVDVATVLAFLTAPLVAVLNFRVVRADNMPPAQRPGRLMSLFSWAGIIFLSGFGLLWIWIRFLA